MTFNAGDVVMLKSGGQALTIASVEEDVATCIWIGEEGDLFRDTIPFVALTSIELGDEEEEDDNDGDEEDADEDEASGEDDEDSEDEEPARRKAIA
jgi:uncharacterized protein YodC (DUF2158 family)